jgi:hypothetical protein
MAPAEARANLKNLLFMRKVEDIFSYEQFSFVA